MTDLTNLYQEIEQELKYYGYSVDDIAQITTNSSMKFIKSFDVKNFLEASKKVDYSQGYGSHLIDLSLRITMKDGSFFQRHEYDGAEWFDYFELRLKADEHVTMIDIDKDITNSKGF